MIYFQDTIFIRYKKFFAKIKIEIFLRNYIVQKPNICLLSACFLQKNSDYAHFSLI